VCACVCVFVYRYRPSFSMSMHALWISMVTDCLVYWPNGSANSVGSGLSRWYDDGGAR